MEAVFLSVLSLILGRDTSQRTNAKSKYQETVYFYERGSSTVRQIRWWCRIFRWLFCIFNLYIFSRVWICKR